MYNLISLKKPIDFAMLPRSEKKLSNLVQKRRPFLFANQMDTFEYYKITISKRPWSRMKLGHIRLI